MANSEPGDQKYEQWKHENKMAPLMEAKEKGWGLPLKGQESQRGESLPDRLRREAKDKSQKSCDDLTIRKAKQDLDRSRSR